MGGTSGHELRIHISMPELEDFSMSTLDGILSNMLMSPLNDKT